MNLMAPNQANIDVFAKNTVNWQGNLPLAGEYRIEIISPPGAASSNYKLEVTVANATPVAPTGSPNPAGSATPAVSPTPASTPAIR
jgi:serine/threonine-protein kinase